MKLVDKDGNDLKIHDIVIDFRGETAEVTGWQKPLTNASTGRVFVKWRNGIKQEHNPNVFDLKWVE